MNEKPVLDYSRLPVRRPRWSAKTRMLVLGWVLASAPTLAASVFGIWSSASSLVAPEHRYHFGTTTMWTQSDGRALDFFNLLLSIGLGFFALVIARSGITKAVRNNELHDPERGKP